MGWGEREKRGFGYIVGVWVGVERRVGVGRALHIDDTQGCKAAIFGDSLNRNGIA